MVADRKISPRHSSGSEEWGTPLPFFEELDLEFGGFYLDAAASSTNYKVDRYFSKEQDALSQSWGMTPKEKAERSSAPGAKRGAVWLNPPYSRGVLSEFFKKAHEESEKHGITVVMLVPPRTSTKYWHRYAMKAHEIRAIFGRVSFVRSDGYQNAAPADSVLVIFRGGEVSEAGYVLFNPIILGPIMTQGYYPPESRRERRKA